MINLNKIKAAFKNKLKINKTQQRAFEKCASQNKVLNFRKRK